MDNRTGWNQNRPLLSLDWVYDDHRPCLAWWLLPSSSRPARLGPSPTADELIVAYLGVLVRFSIGFWIVSWIAFAFLILGALIKLHKVR